MAEIAYKAEIDGVWPISPLFPSTVHAAADDEPNVSLEIPKFVYRQWARDNVT